MEERKGNKRIPVIALTGPTASGKTQTAVELCRRIGGEVICADSMQIYRDLMIGTAAPTKAEMEEIPHHLFGFLSPERSYSVAQYLTDASRLAREIAGKGKVPVLCGGTGLYISSFIRETLYERIPSDVYLREKIQQEFESRGALSLLTEIAEKDPEAAEKIHPNNRKRIVRTLEILRISGLGPAGANILKEKKSKDYFVYPAILNCSDRKMLYNRIELRVDTMIQLGLLDEAQKVYENRNRYLTAAQAIGYKEFFPYFEGDSPLDVCVQSLKKASRNYAKRQLTWFRRMEHARWYSAEDSSPQQLARCIETDWLHSVSLENCDTRGITAGNIE